MLRNLVKKFRSHSLNNAAEEDGETQAADSYDSGTESDADERNGEKSLGISRSPDYCASQQSLVTTSSLNVSELESNSCDSFGCESGIVAFENGGSAPTGNEHPKQVTFADEIATPATDTSSPASLLRRASFDCRRLRRSCPSQTVSAFQPIVRKKRDQTCLEKHDTGSSENSTPFFSSSSPLPPPCVSSKPREQRDTLAQLPDVEHSSNSLTSDSSTTTNNFGGKRKRSQSYARQSLPCLRAFSPQPDKSINVETTDPSANIDLEVEQLLGETEQTEELIIARPKRALVKLVAEGNPALLMNRNLLTVLDTYGDGSSSGSDSCVRVSPRKRTKAAGSLDGVVAPVSFSSAAAGSVTTDETGEASASEGSLENGVGKAQRPTLNFDKMREKLGKIKSTDVGRSKSKLKVPPSSTIEGAAAAADERAHDDKDACTNGDVVK